MKDRQKEVFEKLNDLDESLGRIYLGGLSVYSNESNPDRIPLTAHAIREIASVLARKGESLISKEEKEQIKQDETADKNEKGVNAIRFARFIDPLGGVKDKNTAYHVFFRKYQSEFNPIAHHERLVTKEKFEELIFNFEQFLLDYIFITQPEVYNRIDLYFKNDPAEVNYEDLRNLITLSYESYRYFFTGVPAEWFSFLEKNSFLSDTWEVGSYLERVAECMPREVLSLIMSKSQIGRESMHPFYIAAALKMRPNVAKKMIKKILEEDWLSGEQRNGRLQYFLGDLMEHYIRGKCYDAALKLADKYLDISEKDRYPVIAAVEDYQYYEALQFLRESDFETKEAFLPLLIEKLEKACELEKGDGGGDFSHISLPAIEEHTQNRHHDTITAMLLKIVRDILIEELEVAIANKNQERLEHIKKILSDFQGYNIFKRLKLYLHGVYPNVFFDEVEVEVISEFFEDSDLWHEYFCLVKNVFPTLNPEVRRNFLLLVDNGPVERDLTERQLAFWKGRRLMMVKDHLTDDEKQKYHDFLELEFEEPSFMSFMTGWVGPNSPLKVEEMSTMDPDKLLAFLESWEPPKEVYGPEPSREGFGRELEAVIKNNPKSFIENIRSFLSPKIHPVYVTHLFYGLREALKDQSLDWVAVVHFISEFTNALKESALPVAQEDEGGNWVATSRSIANFLHDLIRRNDNSYLEPLSEAIWNSIAVLCEHLDPTLEHEKEYGGTNMDPYTMSINTVRGEAHHILFEYMVWRNRIKKANSISKETGPSIPNEVKGFITTHLETEESLSVRSVYGIFFPWIISYDKEFAKLVVAKIFPEEDQEKRYAAWETFLAATVFPDAYVFMRSLYLLAINELNGKPSERSYWANPVENLAAHVMLGMIHGLDQEQPPLYVIFFEKANAIQRGEAISFAGRHAIHREAKKVEKLSEIEGMKEFWTWRNSTSKDIEEMKEFGWWVKGGFFEDKWMLEQLVRTLEITEGEIEAEHKVLATLARTSREFPYLSAKALKPIVFNRTKERHFLSVYKKEAKETLESIFRSGDVEAIKLGEQIVDRLTKLGLEEMRYVRDISPTEDQ